MSVVGKVVDKIQSNVKARVDATRDMGRRQVEIVRGALKDLTELKPLKAAIDLVTETLDNVGDWMKRQAEITRGWIG